MYCCMMDQCFKSPQCQGYDCTPWVSHFFLCQGDNLLPNYTCQIAFCCASVTNYIKRRVHRTDPDIVKRESDKWPPDHSLVDVNAPGSQHVSDHEGIAEALKNHIIVVFSAWR